MLRGSIAKPEREIEGIARPYRRLDCTWHVYSQITRELDRNSKSSSSCAQLQLQLATLKAQPAAAIGHGIHAGRSEISRVDTYVMHASRAVVCRKSHYECMIPS